jgi:hypothetical protein
MLKNKKVIIIALALSLIGAGVLFAAIANRPQTNDFSDEIQQAQSQPISETVESFTPPKEDSLIISGVTMNNFYHQEESRTGGNVIFFKTDEYILAYVISNNQFNITITTNTFEETRSLAEKALLTQLGINQEEACKLDVTVHNPSMFNPSSDDRIHRLSFCN